MIIMETLTETLHKWTHRGAENSLDIAAIFLYATHSSLIAATQNREKIRVTNSSTAESFEAVLQRKYWRDTSLGFFSS
jgi:hypothetical protein